MSSHHALGSDPFFSSLRWIGFALTAVLLWASAAPGQEGEPQPLRISGFMAGGARASVTEAWGQLDFSLTNSSDTNRRARVLAFYENQPHVQYGRDLWVPANSTIKSWLPLGPAAPQARASSRELRFVLLELSEGKEQLLLPRTEERIRSQAVIYRPREPTTALVVDTPDVTEHFVFGQLPQPELPGDEAYLLARVFRSVRDGYSDHVQVLDPGSLPVWPTAFDGIDHLIIASARPGQDPGGMQALRHWLERGGRVWVMLDQVDPEAIAPLLGEALDFHLVSRVRLTDFRLEDQLAEPGTPRAPLQQHERPVEFARVQLPPGEAVRHVVDGWPVWFTRKVGRGNIVLTTLGPRGWHRPRLKRDGASPFPSFPRLPAAYDALSVVADELTVDPAERYPVEAFESLLSQEIGYVVLSRATILVIFAVFLLGTLGASALARTTRRPELLGWIGPLAAVGAAAALLVLADSARRGTPPTVAVAQIIEASAGTPEVTVEGLLAVYRPASGPADLGGERGGFFDLDMAAIEGRTRRLIMTDLDAWHWENLDLPAGVRRAPFHFCAATGEPITATARFGPAGLEGKLAAGPLQNLTDGLVTAATARNLALRLAADGKFSAAAEDALAPGHFLAGTILSDRQQRQQEIYRRLLKRSESQFDDDRHLLVVTAEPLEMPFRLGRDARVVGTSLLSLPLRLERTDPGTQVTIPGAFVPYQRVLGDKLSRQMRESTQTADMHLRFQLPRVVLPVEVDRARLTAKILARSRRVAVSGRADGALVELHRVDNPQGPFQVDITEPRFLLLDQGGGLHLNISVSEPLDAKNAEPGTINPDQVWTIEYIELEVAGRTAPS
jgi:hypothetical protein